MTTEETCLKCDGTYDARMEAWQAGMGEAPRPPNVPVTQGEDGVYSGKCAGGHEFVFGPIQAVGERLAPR